MHNLKGGSRSQGGAGPASHSHSTQGRMAVSSELAIAAIWVPPEQSHSSSADIDPRGTCFSHHRWLDLGCIWAWPLQQTGTEQTRATAPFLVSFGGREGASSQQRICVVLGLLSRNVLMTTCVTHLCQREPCLGFPRKCDYKRCVINQISHGDVDHSDLVNCRDT